MKFVKENKWLIATIGLALVSRIAYLFILHPPLTWADASMYDMTAWNLVNGNGYVLTPGDNVWAGREPGYALFFLAPIYLIFGHSILAAQIFQIFLSAGTVFLIYLIGEKFLNRRIGLISAAILALWPADIAYSLEILTEIPFTFLLVLGIFLLLLSVKKKSCALVFASGLILGMTTLTRFNTFFLPVFFLPVFYCLLGTYKQSLKYSALLFLGILIFTAPWFIRNYIEFNAFVFGRLGSGEIYWSGSYIPWDGEWKGYNASPMKEILAKIGNQDPVERDKVFIRETKKNIKENPLGVAKIWLKKPFKIFLSGVASGQLGHSQAIVKITNNNSFAKLLIQGSISILHRFLLAFGLFGLLWLFLVKERFIRYTVLALIIYFVIAYLPMNTDPRYQIPVMPFLIILGSIGIWSIMRIFLGREYLTKNYTNL